MLAAIIALASACDSPQNAGPSWMESPDSLGIQAITDAGTACSNCITITELVTLGRDTSEGFLKDDGTMDDVVRDRLGRYWVGQRTEVKVFAADGSYLRAVGKAGQGPMEFTYAQPVHVDTSGVIHVFDVRVGRETMVRPDFSLQEDRPIPAAMDAIAPLPGDGHRYVMKQWIPTADRLGLPLHIISGSEIVSSFGALPGTEGAGLTPATSARRVTVAPSGYIVSSKLTDYVIEVWNDRGSRLVGLELPGLNAEEVRPGPWAWDKPPSNHIVDIAVDDAQRLWVVSSHRRANWREKMVERVNARGVPFLAVTDGQMTSIYRSRIDVVDLNNSSMLASSWYDGLVLSFVEAGVISELAYDEIGAPLLRVSALTLKTR